MIDSTFSLNEHAATLWNQMAEQAARFRVAVREIGGARVIDAGIDAAGGIEAGLAMAEICLAGLGRVGLAAANPELWAGPAVSVRTDHPQVACLASQYAGWPVNVEATDGGEAFFAMGSGPMRAARGREKVLEELQIEERHAPFAVGVLEGAQLPSATVCAAIARQCEMAPEQLRLVIAPTASLAGTLQVVARSVETALHKLHELGFDLRRIRSGYGTAPLPPVAHNDMAGIGRTNDAVLYGGEVTLWVDGDDESLQEIGPQAPSNSSRDFGRPFAEIFARYEYDFYKIDPHLFSPARVSFWNVSSGSAFHFGELQPELIQQSFTA